MPDEDHQDADVEEVRAPAELAPAKELRGTRLPGVLLALETQQASEQEDRQTEIGVPAKKGRVDVFRHLLLLPQLLASHIAAAGTDLDSQSINGAAVGSVTPTEADGGFLPGSIERRKLIGFDSGISRVGG